MNNIINSTFKKLIYLEQNKKQKYSIILTVQIY